ncbi:MAG: histone deacetylase family protein [Anaerolineae bacterium]|nr:histone deacetylase family protein [Anaerolineae bacterium]
MYIIYSPDHALHNPPQEFMEGTLSTYLESPRRAEIILQAVQEAALGEIVAPANFGLNPILAIHHADYVDHLRTIYERWVALGGAPQAALPSIYPQRDLFRQVPVSPWATVGYYSLDLSAPVTEGTYAAARRSAHVALTGARYLLDGEKLAYALCRPPGHHASADLMGGYCYFNNAAIAAQHLVQSGPVAILDIDVHGGNGTQAIFYERSDVLFISIHGAPEWEYPYFCGYADERGAGAGEGYNFNYPLPKGTDDEAYLRVLDEALAHIYRHRPAYLVLSAGFDTFKDDPLGQLALTTPGYEAIGQRIAALGVPTLVVQEGGYAVDALGQNAVSLLRGLQQP